MPFHLWKCFPVWCRTRVSPWKKLSSGSSKLYRARLNFSVNPRGFYKMLLVHIRMTGFKDLIFLWFVPSSFCEGQDTTLINDFQSYKVMSVCRSLGAKLTRLFSSLSIRTLDILRDMKLAWFGCGCSRSHWSLVNLLVSDSGFIIEVHLFPRVQKKSQGSNCPKVHPSFSLEAPLCQWIQTANFQHSP